jgi:16S rRNA G966 N2-methylase RsmD
MPRMDKRDFLFRFVEPPIRYLIRLDSEAFYSTTDQLTANKIAKIITQIVPPDAVVTDATACVGGATYAFAQVFRRVVAIELDKTRYDFLRHNVTVLGMGERVQCMWGDARQICPTLCQDIIFLDPPWGGPDYKTQEKVSLFLSGEKLSDVCRNMATSTKYIAIKVPTNFDHATFRAEVNDFAVIALCETQLRKMHLLVLRIIKNASH